MEIKILEQSKNKLEFELIGEDHTFCNLFKDALNEDSTVKVATYKIEHPLISSPAFLIEADNPVKAINGAIKKMNKFCSDLEAGFKKLK